MTEPYGYGVFHPGSNAAAGARTVGLNLGCGFGEPEDDENDYLYLIGGRFGVKTPRL